MKKTFAFVLILVAFLCVGAFVGCEDDGDDGDTDGGSGEPVAKPIPDNHPESDCSNAQCHGANGVLPKPDDYLHNNSQESIAACGTCHY